MQALLTVRNLTVALPRKGPDVTIVDQIGFDVLPGEVMGIAGESGSGKTLSMLALMGLLPKTFRISGDARIGDVRLLPRPSRHWSAIRGKEIGMVFQDPTSSLHPMLEVGLQLTEHMRFHLRIGRHAAQARAKQLLEEVRIPDPAGTLHAYPHQFSGGMRQRIAIAMALACSPKLLIADEPTTDLDVTVQASILRLLDEIRTRAGMSIVLITHDLGVLSSIADRIAVLYAGRIVEAGCTHDVLRHSRHPYTHALLNALPTVQLENRRALTPIPGSPPPRGTRPTGCAFHPRCGFAVDRCFVDVPPLEGDEDGQRVACWVDPFRDNRAAS